MDIIINSITDNEDTHNDMILDIMEEVTHSMTQLDDILGDVKKTARFTPQPGCFFNVIVPDFSDRDS